MERNHKLLSDDGPLYNDPAKFRRLVYLTITRSELCYAIHVFSQVMHELREAHWDAVIRVLRYIKRMSWPKNYVESSWEFACTGVL